MPLLITGAIALVGGAIFFVLAIRKSKQTKSVNKAVAAENKELEKRNLELKHELLNLGEQRVLHLETLENITVQSYQITKRIEEQKQEVQTAFENYCEVLDTYYLIKENEHDLRISALKKDYERKIDSSLRESQEALESYMETLERYYESTEQGFDQAIKEISEQLTIHQKELDKIRATYAATKEAQRREEEMALQADFYSLHLTPLELDTISLIEELKPRLPEPRVLSMLIWTTYYQKQMSTLCNNVLGASPVCGIYKITNKKSGLVYIGQAANVSDRWKQHAKCGLGIDTPAQNKLYRAMLADGLTNFTFELVEACPRAQLNEKEKYYIELYQSYEYGYNSNRGVS